MFVTIIDDMIGIYLHILATDFQKIREIIPDFDTEVNQGDKLYFLTLFGHILVHCSM